MREIVRRGGARGEDEWEDLEWEKHMRPKMKGKRVRERGGKMERRNMVKIDGDGGGWKVAGRIWAEWIMSCKLPSISRIYSKATRPNEVHDSKDRYT